MKKPLILLTASSQSKGEEFADASVSLSNRYSNAVLLAGGLPVCMPCVTDEKTVSEMVEAADGIILTGGEDVQTSLYREDVPPKVAATLGEHEPARDLNELLV